MNRFSFRCRLLLFLLALPLAASAASLEGRVVDPQTMLPIPNAMVRVIGPAGRAERFHAGDNGAFLVPDLPKTGWSVRVWHAGYAHTAYSSADHEISATSAPVIFYLLPLGTLKGRVQNPDRWKIRLYLFLKTPGGALRQWIHSNPESIPRERVPDPSGSFEFTDLPPGQFVLAVAYSDPELGAAGFAASEGRSLQVDGDVHADLRISIAPARPERIEMGPFPDRVDLIVTAEDLPQVTVWTGSAAQNQSLSLPRLTPGVYTLLAKRIRTDGVVEYARQTLKIGEGELPKVALDFQPGRAASLSLFSEHRKCAFPQAITLTPLSDLSGWRERESTITPGSRQQPVVET